MHPSLRLAAVHRPLIRFLGRRQWPAKAEEQHPHPFAPPELKEHFGDFMKKFQSATTPSSPPQAAVSGSKQKQTGASGTVFEEFWEAPERFWKRGLASWEIDLVHSGGASRAPRS